MSPKIAIQKVALITGASSGIGLETAKLLLQDNYTVFVAARRVEKMAQLVELGAIPLAMDITVDETITKAVEQITAECGRLDVLINNAGYGSYGSLEDIPLKEAKYQFEVNVFGLARVTQLVLPLMRQQKSGKIINISSIGGKIGEPHGAWYHATKFAVEGLSDSLRMELKQFGIDVVVIQPGPVLTEWNGIARDNLAQVSGNTAYANLAKKHVKMLEQADKQGAHPLDIARVIIKTVNSKHPKTRYAAGKGAKLILFMRKILSDKMFDRVMLSIIK